MWNEPPIGAIKPARQNENDGVGLSSKGETMLEVPTTRQLKEKCLKHCGVYGEYFAAHAQSITTTSRHTRPGGP
jgi:hypothetical protein